MLTWLAVALGTGAAAVVAIGWALRRTDELGRPRRFPWVTVALLLALGAGAAVPGVLRASQERRLGTAASVLAGARVAVRCQSFGGAFADAGPELGYVRWRADGSPEPWTLIKRDQCRHLAAYARSDKQRPRVLDRRPHRRRPRRHRHQRDRPKVNLVALKISQWCGSANDDTLLTAFVTAADMGVDVVNISLGGFTDISTPEGALIYQAYIDTVAYARSKGTIIVASAGNEHVRVGAGGRILSHGATTTPGTLPEDFVDPFGQVQLPGGTPGVVDVAATNRVNVRSSASCPPGTIGDPGDPPDFNATCKPASDPPPGGRAGPAEPALLLLQLRASPSAPGSPRASATRPSRGPRWRPRRWPGRWPWWPATTLGCASARGR